MKVNVSLELSDEQRNHVASMLSGKRGKAMCTRDDVKAHIQEHFAYWLEEAAMWCWRWDTSTNPGESSTPPALPPEILSVANPTKEQGAILSARLAEGWAFEKQEGDVVYIHLPSNGYRSIIQPSGVVEALPHLSYLD